MKRLSPSAAIVLAGIALCALSLFGVRQYGWNASALLHMDVVFGTDHAVAPGVVLYRDGGYDGMLYYEVAKDLPSLFSGGAVSLDSPYRFQRVVLPLLVYGLSFGNPARFPVVTLLVNLAAILGTFALVLRVTKKADVHAFAIVFNPAMLVGLLYALTEPLSMFFMALFFARWERKGRTVDWAGSAALLLSLLARETTVFLIGLLVLWLLYRRQWRQLLPLVAAGVLFVAWQWFLYARLGSLPFRTGGGILTWPFHGPAMTLWWAATQGGMKQLYRLSSLALLAFVIVLAALLGIDWKKKAGEQPMLFLLSGLTLVMFSMDPHMWGALTSIGRVVTPFYPAYVLHASSRDTPRYRALSWFLVAFSVVAAIGIAAVRHPYVVS